MGALRGAIFFKSFWYLRQRCIPLWSCLSSKTGIVGSKMAAWRPFWWYRKRRRRSQGSNFFQIVLVFRTQVHTHMKLFKFENRYRRIQDGRLAAILVVSKTTWALSREQFFFKSFCYLGHRYIPIWSCLRLKTGIVRSNMAAWRPFWWCRKWRGRSQGSNFFKIVLVFFFF